MNAKGFIIKTQNGQTIHFNFYWDEAPVTCNAFLEILPFKKSFLHARVSGEEIWTEDAPKLNIIQENASVFTRPGELVLGPSQPSRAKTQNAMGIYYGEGKGLDSCNIFARVADEDSQLLKELGDRIWRQGAEELEFLISD